MCLICDHFNQGKLTVEEAGRNLEEISDSIGSEHTREVTAMIIEREIEMISENLDLEFAIFDDYTLEDAILDMEFDFTD